MSSSASFRLLRVIFLRAPSAHDFFFLLYDRHPSLMFLKENVEDSQEQDVVEMSETCKGTLKPTLGVLGGEAVVVKVKGKGSFMRKKEV